MNKCTCSVIISDPERKARFAGIFENDHVPIKHPLIEGRAQTGNEVYEFYEAAVERFSEEQKRQIAARVAPVFHLSEQKILADMNNPDFKIPIKADSCSVFWCELHVRCAL